MKYLHPKRIIRLTKEKLYDFFWYYLLPDRWEIKYHFRKKLGYECNLDNPQTFNEKIQWLKLHDRNPLYHNLIDKQKVKSIISNLVGAEYVIPTIATYKSYEDIDFSALPEKFVIKCNHDAGSTMVCTDKLSFDYKKAAYQYSMCLNRDYYHNESRQWGYKNIAPCIIVEKYMSDEGSQQLRDYKFFCFNGKPRFCKVDIDRFTKHQARYFDLEWRPLPFSEVNYLANENLKITMPCHFRKMIEIVTKIAEMVNNPFVRIDLYNTGKAIFFGEVTFYPEGGFGKIEPIEWDNKLGEMIELPYSTK